MVDLFNWLFTSHLKDFCDLGIVLAIFYSTINAAWFAFQLLHTTVNHNDSVV